MADFGEVELSLEKRKGNESIASQTYMPDINIGNVASNNFKSPAQQTFEFDVIEQDDYVIAIYSAASEWSDCIIGQLSLTSNSYVATGIEDFRDSKLKTDAVYDLQGRKIDMPKQKGLYIKNGKKILVKE